VTSERRGFSLFHLVTLSPTHCHPPHALRIPTDYQIVIRPRLIRKQVVDYVTESQDPRFAVITVGVDWLAVLVLAQFDICRDGWIWRRWFRRRGGSNRRRRNSSHRARRHCDKRMRRELGGVQRIAALNSFVSVGDRFGLFADEAPPLEG